MIKAVLQRGDGIGQRAWLRSVVKTVQLGLVNAGEILVVDGRFGPGTSKLAKSFQAANGLEPNGVFDKSTWVALGDHLPQPSAILTTLLVKFNGDLDWVHQQEGFRGRPYWPGGVSGITLDPGVDLGHADSNFVEAIYSPFLTNAQMKALRAVFGFKGHDARDAIKQSDVIQRIRITEQQSIELMPHTTRPYWNGITHRFPSLNNKSTPPSIQTVLLSLAYNRGILNRHLETLDAPLRTRSWHSVSTIVGSMQQNHQLKGIRIRRREEGLLIKSELDYLAS